MIVRNLRARVVPPAECLDPKLAWSVFESLEDRDLRDLTRVCVWWRLQRRAATPVTPGTFADLVLCCAAARRACQIPEAEVRKTRKAIFAGLVGRRHWERVYHLVDTALEIEVTAALAAAAEILEPHGTSEVSFARLASVSGRALAPGFAEPDRNAVILAKTRAAEELEAECGPAFDLLDWDQQIAIASAAFAAKYPAAAAFMLEGWRRARGRGCGRLDVLEFFKAGGS